ncbi:hypothetical protein [Lactobacillus kitasatonis]|uniref:Uncharacterized protein n=1 Tax=Lactobacillus kitasatonis TaxID=237446 RepID=A0ABS1LTV2_9LACO|nr:hypothetical protein [Lactobacillus kitasatonis]MBL1071688.1 hypothetical protein [Lactobacillus kitasatonis]
MKDDKISRDNKKIFIGMGIGAVIGILVSVILSVVDSLQILPMFVLMILYALIGILLGGTFAAVIAATEDKTVMKKRLIYLFAVFIVTLIISRILINVGHSKLALIVGWIGIAIANIFVNRIK